MAENKENTERKGTPCPVCSTGKLKKGEKMVYCQDYKPRKDGNEWYNEGSCEFRITYKNKLFGRDLTDRDIKSLLEGKSLKTKNGDTVTLDLDSDNFLHFEWKERKEDKDF